MRDTFFIRDPSQAAALLKPVRIELLQRLAEPRTCTQMAQERAEPVQKIYYHIKQLEKAGLVRKVGERRVRAIMEGLYQATANSYYLSSSLVGQLGGRRRVRDRIGLSYLLSLADEIREDVGRLAERQDDVASLGLSARVVLSPERRAAFLSEVEQIFKDLATRYGQSEEEGQGDSFDLHLACYPRHSAKGIENEH